ncbi:MAG: hypothetical protein A2711_09650 [Burkholderiales bacterium RIFCSPHIGHO2_01_FULL_63_240]|jgi:hypothetical protein|nr:MAG: hypothetical protein A2711_09650 [Burkholderiales bacterium RIFCSPHIGHO2_01_FULL_63_240]
MRLTPSPKTLRHGLLHLALAVMLLLTQQLVLRHALEHDTDADHPAHSQCLSCLACHAVDHAAAGTPVVSLPGCDATSVQVAVTPGLASAATAVPFRARGPPAFPA